MSDESLEAFMGEVREEVRARAQAGGRVRDFGAVVARARALDPGAVTAEALAEARSFASVIALRRPPAAAAAVVHRRVGVWLAAAAAAALVIAGAAVRTLRPGGGPGPGVAVQHVGPAPPAGSLAGRGRGAGEARARDEGARGAAEGVAPGLEVAAPESVAAGVDRAAGAELEDPPREAKRTGRERHVSKREVRAAGAAEPPWLELDRRAREAWRRGELAEARRLLGELTRSGADAERVELAFGDLFVLARQAGDRPGQEAAWRAYLARFPRGNFAEDASAGLCRGAADRACWAAHLAAWPEGNHAGEARRALGDDGEAP